MNEISSSGNVASDEIELSLRPLPPRTIKCVAIGSSTGGPDALVELLRHVGKLSVPVIITQHMPASFTSVLAKQLSKASGMECSEVTERQDLTPGRAYIASGGRHLEVLAERGRHVVQPTDGPPENFCRPSVEPMLRSIVSAGLGPGTAAVFLTGMGRDGAAAAEEVVGRGGVVLAQDKASSVVWGMPGAVAKAGLCSAICDIPGLAALLVRLVGGRTQ